MQGLRDMIGMQSPRGARNAAVDNAFRPLLESVKEWADRREGRPADDYSAIRLYTSELGYRMMFCTINAAFRENALVRDVRALRSAAFLVELLNVDLFNYCRDNSAASAFQGIVYRGMAISETDLSQLDMIARGPIEQRYISVPMAMVSTSTDKANAMAFAAIESARRPDLYPVLWEIRVASLEQGLMTIYHQTYPESVVTSICAVPIRELSDFSAESEVLLRGPFFQLIRLREAHGRVAGKPVRVVEALMLTANRDHIGSAFMGGRAEPARKLFRILVTMNRAELCAARAEEYRLWSDAEAYHALAADMHTELGSFLGT